MDKIIEKDLSYKLGGIFFEVQNELGRFCRERQYADALEEKLSKYGIKFKRETSAEIGNRKSNFIDFIIEDKILIDLKAKPFIEREDYYQMKRYLNIVDAKLGLIVNFQDKYLKPKRVLSLIKKEKNFVDSHKFVASHRSGFTMVEMLVAMALFLTLTSVSVGGFIRSMQVQRTLTSLMEANDSISLALEKMARELRDGYGFSQPSASSIQFVNRYGQSVVYSSSGSAILRNGQKITADNVTITNFYVRLTNLSYGEGSQPRITMTLSISIDSKYLQNFFIPIQTTISPRMMILAS